MYVLFSFLFLTNLASAQPPNDSPCAADVLPLNITCSSGTGTTTGDNVMATASGVPDPSCGTLAGGADVWYTFTMPSNGYHVSLNAFAGTISETGMAAYVGSDCSSLTELSCSATAGIMETLIVEDGCNFEYAGEQIWIRLWELGNDAQGTFEICAVAHAPIQDPSLGTCGGNIPAADDCCDGVLFSDDLDGFCGNSSNFTPYPVAIPMSVFPAVRENDAFIGFVASETTVSIEITASSCMNFGVLPNSGMQAGIYSSNDCNSFTLVSNFWNPNVQTTGNITATGLVPGEVYYIMIDGWGGDVCDYTISVNSGVQTTTITQNDYNICTGSSIQLGVEVFGVGPYIYDWTPASSLDDPTIQNPIASPTTTTNYSVHVTGIIDTVLMVTVDVESGVPTGLNVSGSNLNCINSTGEVYHAIASDYDSVAWSVSSAGTIVGPADRDSVIIDWGATAGPNSLTLEAFNICGDNSFNYVVNVVPAPNITANDPTPICSPNTFNLGNLSITNNGGVGGATTYYSNMTDADAGSNAITNFVISSGGTYWVRSESAPGCYDISSANIVIEDPQITIITPGATCAPATIDLQTLNITETNNASALDVLTFHNSSADAIANIGALTNTVIGASGTFYARYQTINGCFAVEPVTLTIHPSPDITFTSSLELCAGDCVDLATLAYTDANSTSIVGDQFFGDLVSAQIGIPILEMASTVVCDAGPYFMRTSTTEGCFQITEINLTVNPNPTGSISASSTVCYGSSVNLTFDLNGTGPFDVQYSNGTDVYTLTGISDGHIEPIVLTSNASINLDTVREVGSQCYGLGGLALAIAVNPEVTATLSGDNNICEGQSTDLTFALTGTGPFTITYSDGSSNYVLNNINGPSHTESVTPTTNTTYSLVSITAALNCSGTTSGTATIDVGSLISVNGFTESCNALLTGYTISFDIAGGDPSNYSVTGISGTLTGNTFTSDEIVAGGAYSFSVEDGSACAAVNFMGSYDCNCASDPGLMDQTLVEVCRGEDLTVNAASGTILETGFNQEYVLHDNAGNSLGNVFGRGTLPSFSLVTGMTTGTTYYISSVVGPDNGIGGLDDTHPCYQVSIGTPIVVYDLAQALISGDAISCSGVANTITIDITGGQGPFDVIYTDGINQVALDDINTGHTFSVSPTATTTYTLVSIFDNTNITCQGSVDGSAAITIAEIPVASNLQFECNDTNTEYRLTFDVSGGVMSSYAFSGDPGTFDNLTGVFTSDWYSSGSTYTINIEDANACGTENVTGIHVCNCTSDAGSMETQLMEVCESGTAFFTTLAAPTLDADDVVAYILHNGVANIPFTIFQMNSIPEFTYDPALVFGDTYYVSRIVASDDGSGAPQTDQNIDPCRSISNGQPVVFYPEATVGIMGNLEICEGDDALLQININQPGEYNLVYNNGTGDFPFDNVSNGQIISLPMPMTGTITLVSIAGTVGPNCVGIIDPVNNSVNVTVHELPTASMPVLTCDAAGENYTVSFDITGGNPSAYSVTGGGTLVGNVFTSDPIQSGISFNFEITDGTNCAPTVVSGLNTCLCTFDIAVDVNVDQGVSCFGESDAILNAVPVNGVAPYNYEWSTGSMDQTISDVAPGNYTVTMTDGNGCIRENSFEVIEPTEISANFNSLATICFGSPDGIIEVSNIEGGVGDFEIEVGGLSDVGTNAMFNLPAGNYEVTIYDGNNCEMIENVEVESAPIFEVDLGPDIELSLGDSTNLFASTTSFLDSISWVGVPNVTCSFCETQNVKPPLTQVYSVEVYNAAGCRASDEITVFVDQERPIYIPSAFSPNSDGNNDRFSIFGGASIEKIVSVKIFDRWGAQVYSNSEQTLNDPLEGWNGRFRGKVMDPGVYIYMVEALFIDGKTEMFGGDLTLLK